MNYKYENIFDLEDIVLEQQYDVLNTLINLINKNELFIESGYINNEAYDDFVNEMFSIYTEATARNKRQKAIADYVVKNNLHRKVNEDNEPIKTKYGQKKASDKLKTSGWGDLDGEASDTDSSSKRSGKVYKTLSKKDQRRMVNTLLQHDFDPKTETIRSSVKNPDGSYRRIKLNLTDKDGSYYLNQTNGDYTKKLIHIKPYTMQDKQTNQQLSIGHEDSHHYSNMMGDGRSRYKNKTTDSSDIANQFIDKTKDSGAYTNTHDDGSYNNPTGERNGEELHADLRGWQIARNRTSKWGNASSGSNYKEKLNKGTRKINSVGLLKYFEKMSEYCKKINDAEKRDLMDQYQKGKRAYDEAHSTGKLTDEGALYIWKFIFNSASMSNERSDANSKLIMLKSEIDNLQRSVENLKKFLDETEEKEYFSKKIDDYLKQLDNAKKSFQEYEEKIKKLRNSRRYDQADLFNYQRLDDIDKENVSKKYIPALELHVFELDKLKKTADSIVTTGQDIMESSTKMRYDFVMKYGNPSDYKKHNPGTSKSERLAKKREHIKQKQEMLNKKRGLIKEYFTDFFNEYYSLDWLIG